MNGRIKKYYYYHYHHHHYYYYYYYYYEKLDALPCSRSTTLSAKSMSYVSAW